ncbi:MAG: thioredoxin domain-containing protein [Nanoarchaeota archaeon]
MKKQIKSKINIITLIILIVGILLLLFALGFYTMERLNSQVGENTFLEDPTFGSEDADVTIIYYFDYQCKWCQKFDLETFPILKQEYIDTGKLKFIFKDFAFLGKDSQTLALAAECIYRKYGSEKFLEYHLLTYQNQHQKGSGWGSKENILTYSKSIDGIDLGYLDSCIINNTYLAEIVDDTYSGTLAGVSSTPTFFIGDKKISGAQPYSVFRELIETPDADAGNIVSESISTLR